MVFVRFIVFEHCCVAEAGSVTVRVVLQGFDFRARLTGFTKQRTRADSKLGASSFWAGTCHPFRTLLDTQKKLLKDYHWGGKKINYHESGKHPCQKQLRFLTHDLISLATFKSTVKLGSVKPSHQQIPGNSLGTNFCQLHFLRKRRPLQKIPPIS